jgi:hypothetical protein
MPNYVFIILRWNQLYVSFRNATLTKYTYTPNTNSRWIPLQQPAVCGQISQTKPVNKNTTTTYKPKEALTANPVAARSEALALNSSSIPARESSLDHAC